MEAPLKRASSGSSSSSSTPSSQGGSNERGRFTRTHVCRNPAFRRGETCTFVVASPGVVNDVGLCSGNSAGKTDGSTHLSHETKDDSREVTRPSRPAVSTRTHTRTRTIFVY